MPRVFISYVHEDNKIVWKLADTLKAYSIDVWLDREQLSLGDRWSNVIRASISQGDFFIACFSTNSQARTKTYMNEELTLAIEELRQRPFNRIWFIPVLLSDCQVPDRSIGAGETLRSIQWLPLYQDWNEGIRRILSVIQPGLAPVHEAIHSLNAKFARVRIKAADDLRKMGSTAKDAIPALLKALDDENETVRAVAADALGEIGMASEEVISTLLRKLCDLEFSHSVYVSKHARDAASDLLRSNPSLIPRLIQILEAEDHNSSIFLILANSSALAKAATRLIVNGLKSDTIQKSIAIIEILGYLSVPDAIPALIHLLSDESAKIRSYAVRAVGEFAIKRGKARYFVTRLQILPAVAAILPMVDDPSEQVRIAVPQALGELNYRFKLNKKPFQNLPVISTLVKGLNDSSEMVRRSAAWELGRMHDPLAVSALINALHDKLEIVRISAAEALMNFGDALAIQEVSKEASRLGDGVYRVKSLMDLVNNKKEGDFDK